MKQDSDIEVYQPKEETEHQQYEDEEKEKILETLIFVLNKKIKTQLQFFKRGDFHILESFWIWMWPR